MDIDKGNFHLIVCIMQTYLTLLLRFQPVAKTCNICQSNIGPVGILIPLHSIMT